MKMEFDKHKFLKLLKEIKSLRKEGKFLRDYDKAKSEELDRDLILLEAHIFWESRKKYWQILNSFVRKKINLDEFFSPFYGLRGSNLRFSRLREENLEVVKLWIFIGLRFGISKPSSSIN
jgi:hypothetical protein